MYIRSTSNNLAELEALEKGLNLCHELEVTKFIIEGDSQITLNTVRKPITLNCVLNSKLGELLNLFDQFNHSQICHIFQEGNQKADYLAKKGADGVNFQVFNDVS